MRLGPVDGEIGIAWWANDFDIDFLDVDADVGSLFVHGETWVGDKWGIRGAWFDSDLEGETFSDQSRIQFEVRRRFLSFTDNNFIALGAGAEQIDLLDGSDSRGFRVSAEARFGIPGPVFFYGKIAYVPSFEDARQL